LPYENGYYIDKRIIYQHIYGEATLEDLKANLEGTNILIEEGIAPIHVISDLREVVKFPMNINQLKDLYTMSPHPKMGFTILLTNSTVLRFFISIIVQFVKTDYKMVNNYEEALDLLRRIDPTLEGLEPVQNTLPGQSATL
jgi:hypothetical protein